MNEISIILPMYKTNPEVAKRLIGSLKKQKHDIKIEFVVVDKGIDKESMKMINSLKNKKNAVLKIIKVDPSISFASSMNAGIENAKNEILIILQQDCIPQGKEWVEKLVEPFQNKDVVATASKVELPEELWNKFDSIAKILSVKEQEIVTPLLDEKGCAYRKSALVKVGLFNSKEFRTAGEDFDMYIKLKKIGTIKHPDINLIHYHPSDWRKRLYKELQLSNGFGALVRIYGKEVSNWYIGFLKAIPVLGWPLFLPSIEVKKLRFLSMAALSLYLVINFIYSYGFWKGFLSKKQTV